jgi:hypothetical protein
MHHDNVPYTLLIDFRGEQAAIVYTGFPKAPSGMDDLTVWFEDGRPWPDDLTGEEMSAICEAIERDACERMAADQPYGFGVKRPTI